MLIMLTFIIAISYRHAVIPKDNLQYDAWIFRTY